MWENKGYEDRGRMSIDTPFRGSLFANDFLCESIIGSPDCQAIDDSALDALKASVRDVFDGFPIAGSPNESQTEDDLIWPVLLQLGWKASLRQQNLSAQGVKANVIFFDNHEASPNPWTKQVWYYDYRTNIHHTLKKKPMRFDDLSDFVSCYHPQNRHKRKATWDEKDTPEGRWRSYSYEEIRERDKTNLDIFWLKDKSLTDLDNLPEPDDLAEEIIENLEAGLNSFREVLAGLRQAGS